MLIVLILVLQRYRYNFLSVLFYRMKFIYVYKFKSNINKRIHFILNRIEKKNNNNIFSQFYILVII